jgi:hypothetical protein
MSNMPRNRINTLIGGRLFFGGLALAAIGKQLSIQINNNYSIVNFFSYFTNLSNIFAAVMLIVGAVYLIGHREPTVTEELIRGSSVVSMALVGIVFSLLLRDVDLGHLLPWVNIVLHYIMPVVVVADWLYQPPTSKLVLKQAAYWLIFPFSYLSYSIIYGLSRHFYAYPFFNPDKVGGYGGVVFYCLAIMTMFFILGWLLITLGNKLRHQ